MCPEKIGLPESCQHGEERFGAAHFFPEILKGMRQSMANREPQYPQAEGIEENGDLVAHPQGAVLQVAVIEAQAGIKQDFFYAITSGHFDLAREIVAHPPDRIDAQFEVSHFPDIGSLHIANDYG